MATRFELHEGGPEVRPKRPPGPRHRPLFPGGLPEVARWLAGTGRTRTFAHTTSAAATLVLALGGWVGPASAAASADGLVVAYGFGEGAGVADASGNGDAGVIAGAAWTADGRFGGALAFDGVDDQVTVPDADSLDLEAMTLEAWVRPTALAPRWRTVLAKQHAGDLAYALYGHNTRTGRPSAQVYLDRAREATGGAALAVDAWTHLAASYDGASLRVYLNGQPAGTIARTGAIAAATGTAHDRRQRPRRRRDPVLQPGAGHAGSFTIAAQTADPESGIERVGFPAIFGIAIRTPWASPSLAPTGSWAQAIPTRATTCRRCCWG